MRMFQNKTGKHRVGQLAACLYGETGTNAKNRHFRLGKNQKSAALRRIFFARTQHLSRLTGAQRLPRLRAKLVHLAWRQVSVYLAWRPNKHNARIPYTSSNPMTTTAKPAQPQHRP